MLARTLADASQVLRLASRACRERQLWAGSGPDALGMAHEVEGAVETDTGSSFALLTVVLETADKRIRWTESEIAHSAIDSQDHRRFDLLD